MNNLCTLFIDGKLLGTIIMFPRSLEGVDFNERKNNTFYGRNAISQVRISTKDSVFALIEDLKNSSTYNQVELKLNTDQVVDEPLRKLSSNGYIIIHKDIILYNDKVYNVKATLPIQCHYKAIPFINRQDIIDYKNQRVEDEDFLREGYAKELREAQYVLIPPKWSLSHSCTPYDLLIKKKEDQVLITFSGRKISSSDLNNSKTDGRYIYLSSMPKFSGDIKLPPYTYTPATIVIKYDSLNYRLQSYGEKRVNSICVALNSLSSMIKSSKNQYELSNLYDEIVKLQDKIKALSS